MVAGTYWYYQLTRTTVTMLTKLDFANTRNPGGGRPQLSETGGDTVVAFKIRGGLISWTCLVSDTI